MFTRQTDSPRAAHSTHCHYRCDALPRHANENEKRNFLWVYVFVCGVCGRVVYDAHAIAYDTNHFEIVRNNLIWYMYIELVEQLENRHNAMVRLVDNGCYLPWHISYRN